MKIVKIISIFVVILSAIWLIFQPGFDPLITLGVSLITTISLFIVEKQKNRNNSQNQEISDSSIGIQAGGNISIHGNGDKRKHD